MICGQRCSLRWCLPPPCRSVSARDSSSGIRARIWPRSRLRRLRFTWRPRCRRNSFRGLIQNAVQRLIGSADLPVAAIIFGFAHLPDLRYVLLATLAGLSYGWVYARMRRSNSQIQLTFACVIALAVMRGERPEEHLPCGDDAARTPGKTHERPRIVPVLRGAQRLPAT
ncbi:MAG: lysostaphin resistance A-like protein [Vicinamibacterales bacterium]